MEAYHPGFGGSRSEVDVNARNDWVFFFGVSQLAKWSAKNAPMIT
jgi:hypothetical protein